MLEGVVQQLVMHFASKYLHGVDAQQFSLLSGELVLGEVKLNLETIQEEMELPFRLKVRAQSFTCC